MDAPPAKKIKLSKGILEMRFMKKSKERVEVEEEKEAGEAFFHVNKKSDTGANYVIVESYGPILNLRPGRLSFLGMNPEIERIMEEEKAKSEQNTAQKKIKKREDVDISDDEMAERYLALNNAEVKEFYRKGPRSQSGVKGKQLKQKVKFLKPQD